MKTKQTGFTLVEIAIVLVIIGLLLGGILKGQEMIVQAKVKNSIQDFSGVSAAYYGYQDRYRATPGDDPGADRWTGATKGNGDRVLTGKYNTVTAGDESALWWDHLRRSGFVTGGSGVKQPDNAFNGMLGVQTGDGPAVGTAPAAVLGTITNLIMCSSNLPDKVAIALDVQMDDGQPGGGAVRGFKQAASGSETIAAAAEASYLETGTNLYTLCRQF